MALGVSVIFAVVSFGARLLFGPTIPSLFGVLGIAVPASAAIIWRARRVLKLDAFRSLLGLGAA